MEELKKCTQLLLEAIFINADAVSEIRGDFIGYIPDKIDRATKNLIMYQTDKIKEAMRIIATLTIVNKE